MAEEQNQAEITLEKIERLNDLADKLEELERLKRAVRYQAYTLEKIVNRHKREDKVRRFLLLFFAGFCYGVLTIAILES